MVLTLLMGLAACTADADDGGDALDEDVAEELRAVVADAADGQTGGMFAWIDTPEQDLALAAGLADIATGKELTGDEAFRVASMCERLPDCLLWRSRTAVWMANSYLAIRCGNFADCVSRWTSVAERSLLSRRRASSSTIRAGGVAAGGRSACTPISPSVMTYMCAPLRPQVAAT